MLVAAVVGGLARGARQRDVGRRAVQHAQDAVDVLLVHALQLGRQGCLRVLHPFEIQPHVAVACAVGGGHGRDGAKDGAVWSVAARYSHRAGTVVMP